MNDTQPSVRPMAPEDVEATVAMFARVADEGLWIGTEAGFDVDERIARWREFLDSPDRFSLVAVHGVEIVGLAGITLTPQRVAEVGMALAAPWRGRGLGGRLLDGLIEAACRLGSHKLALQVWPHNGRAMALYRSRGFTLEGRLVRHQPRASGELWDVVLMGLVLDHDAPGCPHADELPVS